MRTCTLCNQSYGQDVRICIACGVDLETGEPLSIEVREPVFEEALPPQGVWKVLYFVGGFVPGIIRLPTVIGSLLVWIAIPIILYFASIVFSVGAMYEGIIMAAGAYILYAHSLAWLIGARVEFLSSALADFTARQWWTFLVLCFGPVFLSYLAIGFVAAAVNS